MTDSIVFPQVFKNIEIRQQQWEQNYSVSDCPDLPENKKIRGIIYTLLYPFCNHLLSSLSLLLIS